MEARFNFSLGLLSFQNADFLNSERGGTLLIGVRNDKGILDLAKGDYEATNKKKKNQDGYALYLNDKILKLLGVNAAARCKIAFCKSIFAIFALFKFRLSLRQYFLKVTFMFVVGTEKLK